MKKQTDAPENIAQATFAGGCFWCLEAAFAKVPGVLSVTSGYSGGHTENPTYEEVCGGQTGHAEAVRLVFDPERVSYKELLEIFWRNIDPTDAGGQFADRGSQYRSVVFYHTDAQRAEAEASLEALGSSGVLSAPIATTIVPAQTFYPAEDYHQEFSKKNPLRYESYSKGSGRQARLACVWGGGRK